MKRVYDKLHKSDGMRILVDRLWPRGLSKDKARIDHWMKEIAPGTELRKWFGHREERWEEFRRRYFEELKSSSNLIKQLKSLSLSKGRNVTLLYAAKDSRKNNAVALLEFLTK